jgi:hypothetical protein
VDGLVGKGVSKIVVNFDGLRRTRWHEYGIRFLAGGTITALVGIIGRKFGPSIGGLFLAFQAIFPASATLVEKHELEKKRNAGVNGVLRSREVAGVDAAGAAMGSLGLLAFALFVSYMLPRQPVWQVLLAGAPIWMAVSAMVWWICRRI